MQNQSIKTISAEKPIYSVSYRGGFADRNGIIPENTMMQIDSFDERTRTAIRNLVAEMIHISVGTHPSTNIGAQNDFWRSLYRDVYSQPISFKNYYFDNNIQIIDSTIYYDNYASILSLLEYLIEYFSKDYLPLKKQISQKVNSLFEKEYVGYRYIEGIFVPITAEIETNAIEEALSIPYSKVKCHVENALRLLSDRDQPDYANSIKESISAVEAMCSIIIGKATTLSESLKELENSGVVIHPSLKAAFTKLYGYTSDAAGIRHTGQLDGADATFDEAKYMAVSCSAFVNYLLGVYSK